MRLLIISLLLLISYGCDDPLLNTNSAPSWPNNAVVSLVPTETEIEVTWPEAQDDRAVDHYQVRLNEQDPIDLRDSSRAYTFDRLIVAQEYIVSVQAFDTEGESSESLTASTYTIDQSPPTWVEGEIRAENISSQQIELTWSVVKIMFKLSSIEYI